MLHRTFLLLLAVFGFSACQALPIPADHPFVQVELGEAATLRRGMSVEVMGEDLVVTFDELPSDGRCPEHMSCTATLPVEVVVRVRSGDGSPGIATLSAHTTTDGAVIAQAPGVTPTYRFGPYTIALERVLPYPDVDYKFVHTPYQVTLRVTRDRTVEIATDTQTPVLGRLGEPVTLALGQRALFAPAALQATVAGVDDKRCPQATICATPTIVIVNLNVQLESALQKATVGGVTDENGHVVGPLMETRGIPWAQVGPYTIELTDVSPYPQAGMTTAPEKYAVTLVVTQAEVQLATPESSPSPEPLPTPGPTAETEPPLVITTSDDVPVLSIDSAGQPVLCVSYRALTLFAAGASTEPPYVGTPLPIGAISLATEAAGDAICAMFLGDGWQIADAFDLVYAAALPDTGAFWVWDGAGGAALVWEAGR